MKKEYLESFEIHHGAVTLTCRKVNIHMSTYTYWRDHDAEFNQAIIKIKESIKDKVEYSLIRDALKKGGVDRMFYMKTQMRDRGYMDRVETINSNQTDYKLNQIDVDLIEKRHAEIKAEGVREHLASLKKDEAV